MISWQHMKIWADGQGVWVSDAGSTNGTFVNGILIGKNKTREIQYNDKIRFGKSSKAKKTKKCSQKPVKVPTFVLLKVPLTTKEKRGPDDNHDSKDDLGLSPIAKSSSQLSSGSSYLVA